MRNKETPSELLPFCGNFGGFAASRSLFDDFVLQTGIGRDNPFLFFVFFKERKAFWVRGSHQGDQCKNNCKDKFHFLPLEGIKSNVKIFTRKRKDTEVVPCICLFLRDNSLFSIQDRQNLFGVVEVVKLLAVVVYLLGDILSCFLVFSYLVCSGFVLLFLIFSSSIALLVFSRLLLPCLALFSFVLPMSLLFCSWNLVMSLFFCRVASVSSCLFPKYIVQ